MTTSPPTSARRAPDAVDQRRRRRARARTCRATCAPMIGKTSCLRVVVMVDHDVAGEVHHRDHDARSWRARRSAPGRRRARRTSSRERRAGARPVGGRSARAARRSARVGPHAGHEREPTSMNAPRGEPRHDERVARRASCPAKIGLKTAGPSTAPKTAPKSTRRSRAHGAPAGTCRRPRRGRAARPPPAAPTSTSPATTSDARRPRRAERRQRAARRARDEAAGDHRHAPDAVHRPPGGQRRRARRARKIAGPSPRSPSTPVTSDEGQRRDGGDELQDRRVDGQRGRQQSGVPADREAGDRGRPRGRRPHGAQRRRVGVQVEQAPRSTTSCASTLVADGRLPTRSSAALEPLVGERLDLAAVVAHEVVMVLAAGKRGLVARDAVAEVDALHEAAARRAVERAVDAGDADLRSSRAGRRRSPAPTGSSPGERASSTTLRRAPPPRYPAPAERSSACSLQAVTMRR